MPMLTEELKIFVYRRSINPDIEPQGFFYKILVIIRNRYGEITYRANECKLCSYQVSKLIHEYKSEFPDLEALVERNLASEEVSRPCLECNPKCKNRPWRI